MKMGFTISKKKQPVESSFLKKGKTFFRVKSNGVFVNDFKTKSDAKKFIKKKKK